MKPIFYNQKLAYNLFCVIAITLILYVLKPVIVPLLFSAILSIMVYPSTKFLERKFRLGRISSILFSLISFILAIVILFYLIGIQITDILNQGDQYANKLGQLYQNIASYLQEQFGINKKDIISANQLKLENIVKNNVSKITDILAMSGTVVSDILLIPLYMFFMLFYRKFFINFIHKAFPNKNNTYLNIILEKIYNIQQEYLVGMGTVMLIVGILNSIGLLLLGVDYALFFGFLGALLLLVPYLGIIAGSLLPALFAFATKDSAWYSLGVIGIFALVQIIEGNYITPKITGSKVSLNAFVSIISLVMFSMLWGISGMILALPITASFKIILDQIPNLKPYGYLLGEPEEELLTKRIFNRLKNWKTIQNQTTR